MNIFLSVTSVDYIDRHFKQQDVHTSTDSQLSLTLNSWWSQGLVLPIAIAFIVGIPLAIYGGLICGRIVQFNQALLRARLNIESLKTTFRNLPRYEDLMPAIHNAMTEPIFMLKADQQFEAAWKVNDVFANVLNGLQDALYKNLRPNEDILTLTPERWQSVVWRGSSDAFHVLENGRNDLRKITMSRLAAYYLSNTVTRSLHRAYLRESECAECRKRGKRTI